MRARPDQGKLLAQGVAEANLANPDPQQLKKVEEIIREDYLSCMLLRGADSLRYQQLKNNLANDMAKGTDNYPKTIVETMRILND